jgi:hypothetical protein
LQGTSASQHRQDAFLWALHDEAQQEMAKAWLAWPEVPEAPEEPEVRAAQQEAREEPNVRVAQHEAPEESNVEDEASDQPLVTYRLDQF